MKQSRAVSRSIYEMTGDQYCFVAEKVRQVCEENPENAQAWKACGLVLNDLARDNNHNTIAILRDAKEKLKRSLELDKDPETLCEFQELDKCLDKVVKGSSCHPNLPDMLGSARETPELDSSTERFWFHPKFPNMLGRAQETPESSSTEETLNLANAEARNVRPRIRYVDSTLPSSWWELISKEHGIRYYWNDVTNVIQYKRPLRLLPILPPMSTVYKPPRPSKPLVKPMEMRVADNVTPRIASSPNSNLGDMFSPPAGAPVLQHSTQMLCSETTNILPTFARLSSFTSCVVPSMGMPKDSLYLSFVHRGGGIHWCYLNLGERGDNVKDSVSKQKFITTLLDEPTKDSYATFIAVNSSIYRIVTSGTKSSATSVVQVVDIDSLEGLFTPSWKEFTPLVKARVKPWAVHMRGKIYVVGADFDSKEMNDVEVLTIGESSKWETLILHLPIVRDWFDYFVVAVEDLNKLVIGTAADNCLFVYDACTHSVERLELQEMMPWSSYVPPVVVGNKLFVFFNASICAFDLVEKSYWYGTIGGLGISFFWASCNENEDPRLIYLGGGKLCLICVKSDTPDEDSVHVCLFGVPEFREQGGSRSLHGVVHSIHKFYMGNIRELSNVLLI